MFKYKKIRQGKRISSYEVTFTDEDATEVLRLKNKVAKAEREALTKIDIAKEELNRHIRKKLPGKVRAWAWISTTMGVCGTYVTVKYSREEKLKL